MRTAPVRCSGGLRTVAAAEPGEGWTSFRDAVDSGKGCVVLDPSRPGFPAAAEHAVDAAVRAGRVSPGHLVLFTSGTTSRPRAVHRTLASWERAVAPFTQLTGIGATDRVWVPGSLSSTLFLFGAFHAHRVGADLLLTSQPAGRASAVHCVPAQLPAILAEHQAGRLPALTTVVCAGDRLAEAVAARVVSRGLRLVRYYGAAELSFVAAGLGDGPLYPFPGVEVTVREGVLWSRSRLHALGYLDPTDPGPFRRDGHGWATVGDLGEVIPEPASGRQQVVVRGRGEAAVTVAGHTVVVADVEQVPLL